MRVAFAIRDLFPDYFEFAFMVTFLGGYDDEKPDSNECS